MIKYTLHNHVYLCKHAIGTASEMIESALKEGFELIGISDHIPLPIRDTRYKMEMNQKDDYLDDLQKLKEKYHDSAEILAGFEAEYQEEFEEYLFEYLQDDRLDYLILGQHHQDLNDLYTYYGNSDNEKNIVDYVDQCIEGMKTGVFLILAHPDLFMYNLNDFDEVCYRESTRLIEAAIKYDVYLEYNAGGVRKGLAYNLEFKEYQYPRYEFWQLVADKQAKVVLSADAHSPAEIKDKAYDLALTEMNVLGLNYYEELDLKPYYQKIEHIKKHS